MRFIKFLLERSGEEKRPPVFKETDEVSPFPEMTINALQKQITTMAKDLETEWKNSAELVNAAFKELEVPLPPAYRKERWAQYKDLLSHAVKQLYKARGLKSGWTQTV